MKTIDRNYPPLMSELKEFINKIDFILPIGFVDFFRESNGANITSKENYTLLWTLTEMIELNKEYDVEEYAPEFFLFGSDGGDIAFGIEKLTGEIFELPFIGMSKDEAMFISSSFVEFLKLR